MLVDIFLTVLYARVGTSVFSNRVARLTWRVFRRVARFLPRHQGVFLSFCGPIMLLLLVAFWSAGLMLGMAMVFHPKLGTAIRAAPGQPTPTDFVTAMYAAGNSMTIVGAGDFAPQTRAFKLLYMFNSLVGMCMLSLTLTYFMQIYSSLQRRNTAALRAHLATDETGDAAELVAGIGPEGDFSDAPTRLSEMAGATADVKETHHFYSLLMYFRFREPFYSVTRLAVINLDTVALIKTALDDERYAALKESAAVADLQRSSYRLLVGVGPALLPHGIPESRRDPDEPTRDQWRRRYFAAVRRLHQAGIKTTADPEAGAGAYVSQRTHWDHYITAYAEFMAYDLHDIDPAGTTPEEIDRRPDFRERAAAWPGEGSPSHAPPPDGSRAPHDAVQNDERKASGQGLPAQRFTGR
jgi:hypothetical protein